jgi:uncharacterized protein YcaQ
MDTLDKLLYKDRVLVDAWDKEMSIYRTEEWPYFSRIRSCHEKNVRNTLIRRNQEEALGHTARILESLKNRGPLSSNDIDLGKCTPNRWGHKKIAGAAFDYLLSKGDIGVYKRKNVQKIYDIIQNLLPGKIIKSPDPFDTDIDFYEWYVTRRIGSIGVHWLRNGGGWNGYYLSCVPLRKKVFVSLENKGVIVPITTPEINAIFYIEQRNLRLLRQKPDYDGNIRVLAPLDNLLWDRMLVQKVFDFQYSWEVYLPPEKRKYGYYVLPILYQNRIVARMEPVKQETGKPFSIKNWWWEQGVTINRKLRYAVKNGLNIFSEYVGSEGLDKKTLEGIFGR